MRGSGPVGVIAAVAVLAVLSGCAAAPPGRTEVGTRPGTVHAAAQLAAAREASDAVVAERVPAAEPGCSAAVARKGVVLWAGAGGMADLKHKIPDTIETRFDIASVSKQFTAISILMLQREGKLKVSDPIARYVGGLPPWGASVTLDQLIHHTSRIPDYWVELDEIGIGFSDPADQAATLDAIRRATRLEPGSGFLYSNSNYVLLAEVVRKTSGLTLPQFLDERIFTPLGLDMVLAPTLHADDIALSYDDDLNRQEAGWTSYGHTGIITTASELVRWGDQYRKSDIIQQDFFDGAVYEAAGEYYAAGMDIEVDGDLNHTGRMGGFVSDFTVSADRETTIAVMCNGHLSDRFGIAKDLWAIWGRPLAE
ncbi:MAG TPA: serine hydrolase domain-containing protein [Pseudolysinimonas sp.]|nr:serine hydrolase domain-containing protein [Pseudolysinimonas sp.]